MNIPLMFSAMFDNGSDKVLIDASFADQLGLRRRRLHVPERIRLAMDDKQEDAEIELTNYVKLLLFDPVSMWTAKSVRAIVAPNLCVPILLGLLF
jgi:hypothetical protein